MMRRIAELSDKIREEVAGARGYAVDALQAKDAGNASDARTFAEMANQELGHADKLHAMVVNLIGKAQQDGAEVPDGMMRVWEFEHSRIIESTAEVRSLLQMLNG